MDSQNTLQHVVKEEDLSVEKEDQQISCVVNKLLQEEFSGYYWTLALKGATVRTCLKE